MLTVTIKLAYNIFVNTLFKPATGENALLDLFKRQKMNRNMVQFKHRFAHFWGHEKNIEQIIISYFLFSYCSLSMCFLNKNCPRIL